MTDRPNILFIMTDNQGAWTLGCHGNPDIRTPNIDRLAAEGTRCSRAYCVNSVCSPNRATCLTGLLPSQHGVHSFLGGEKPSSQMGPGAYCTIQEFSNLPTILSGEGYVCGMTGKWHLGDSLHPQLGFSYWFNRPHGSTATFNNDDLIWEGKVYKEPRYTTDVVTDHAVNFIRQNQEQPFFLYLPYNGPYGLGKLMQEVHQNQYTDYYRDKELASFPRTEMHPWLFNNRDMLNNPMSIRSYAALISGVDDGVGRVLDELDELGLAENTLVIFTADQGHCGGHHGMWGMGDHSRPIHTFEESVRIPLLYRHPARIPAGQIFDPMTCNYDFFPTLLEYLGLGDRIPDASILPGESFAAALTGRSTQRENRVFFEFENTRMVETDEWKLTWRSPAGPHELYDMRNDPGETANLADSPAHQEVLHQMKRVLDDFFQQYADPEYDLWGGGRSKAGRLIKDWTQNR